MSSKIIPVSVRANQDELHMAYMGVKSENRMLHEELTRVQREKREQEKERRAKKRMALEFARVLGLSLAAVGCIASAAACDFSNAPWWTVIAPLVLLVLIFRKV